LDIRQNGKNDFNYKFYQNIPLMALENRIDELKHDRDYVIVCDYGISSVAAASIISNLGKNNIRILAGGIKSL
jgi:rhodanese-related sulfurtransferase